MRYPHIIFDLDGTLIDSAEAIVLGLRLSLTGIGHPIPDEQTLRDQIGVPLDATFDQGLGVPRERVADCRAIYRDYWLDEGRSRTRLMPGVLELLKELQQRGCQMAVATAKTTDGAWNSVRRHALEEFFGHQVFGYEPEDGPGKNGVVGRAKAALGDPNTVFIGDALGDAQAAHHHDLGFVYCRFGYGDDVVVETCPRLAAVDQFEDLAAHLLHR